jgi:ABC-type dipeptide/oligopeptide/nickel transport system permease subunit
MSRLIWGGRTSPMVGMLPTVAAGSSPWAGLVAGHLGGVVDHVIMRGDVFLHSAVPSPRDRRRHRPRHG